MLNRLLIKSSCVCDEAKDGADALSMVTASLASTEPYHGVFMDSSMPIMTGTTLYMYMFALHLLCHLL